MIIEYRVWFRRMEPCTFCGEFVSKEDFYLKMKNKWIHFNDDVTHYMIID